MKEQKILLINGAFSSLKKEGLQEFFFEQVQLTVKGVA